MFTSRSQSHRNLTLVLLYKIPLDWSFTHTWSYKLKSCWRDYRITRDLFSILVLPLYISSKRAPLRLHYLLLICLSSIHWGNKLNALQHLCESRGITVIPALTHALPSKWHYPNHNTKIPVQQDFSLQLLISTSAFALKKMPIFSFLKCSFPFVAMMRLRSQTYK